MPGPIIAIDGPSGSGKSSTSRGVAQRLGLRYVDTGAMYRAMAWWMLAQGIDVDDPAAIAARCDEPVIELGVDPADPGVRVDGRDVSAEIREAGVADAVSRVAAVPEVRALLVRQQRAMVAQALADGTGVVMEGRDIGTVVFPDAELKVYLDARPEVRAARRSKEVTDLSYETVAADLARRDALDQGRANDPLATADDAVVIDTSDMTVDEIVDAIVAALA